MVRRGGGVGRRGKWMERREIREGGKGEKKEKGSQRMRKGISRIVSVE